RCLSEGRRAFLKRVAGIEAGAECDRLTPLISKVADGEASPEEMRIVRPHLKGCLACKATLREYRETPARVAGLVPPVVALAGGGGGATGVLARLLDRFAWVGDRFAALGDRVQGMGDTAGAKAAAVAASAVVIAGGGAAGIDAIHHDAPKVADSAFAAVEAPSAAAQLAPAGVAGVAAASAPATEPPGPSTAAIDAVKTADRPPASGHEEAPTPSPQPASPEAAAPAGPKPEFDPGTTTGSPAQAAPAPAEFTPPATSPRHAGTQRAASTHPQGSSGATVGEFSP
ncbi:MAG TPA: zf-HC2 domain-containing protein, partial [Thermoleophilaceae bacterium]|nr:zf-HC2 domain-containing protein [Thermoleophilaceae bacterium]